jgi:hypothetical protein
MVETDLVAIAARPAGTADGAVRHRDDRGAVAAAEIEAAMHPGIAEDRVHPQAVT